MEHTRFTHQAIIQKCLHQETMEARYICFVLVTHAQQSISIESQIGRGHGGTCELDVITVRLTNKFSNKSLFSQSSIFD